MTSDTIISPAAPPVSHGLMELSSGNDTSRAELQRNHGVDQARRERHRLHTAGALALASGLG